MTDFKPRWIRWDEDAFRADRQVNRMTPRQRAMCRNLMIESYYNELRPYLPADDAQLWQLADADSPEDWLQNKASVIVKFKPVTGEDGEPLLSNKRVMEEWAALQASLEQKRSAAAKSVAARRQRVRERENLPHSPSENKNQKEKENKSVERPLNERSTSVRESLSTLAAELKQIGGYVFAGKDLAGLGGLLEEFTAEDLKAGWEQFISRMDDFQLRSANRAFVDGGARTTIEARRIERQREDEREARRKSEWAIYDQPRRERTPEEQAEIERISAAALAKINGQTQQEIARAAAA